MKRYQRLKTEFGNRHQGRGLGVGLKEYSTFGGNKRRYSYLTVTAGIRSEGGRKEKSKKKISNLKAHF
jgi:hypothetical protein